MSKYLPIRKLVIANKHGTSYRVSLAKSLIDELGWQEGDQIVQRRLGNNAIVLVKLDK